MWTTADGQKRKQKQNTANFQVLNLVLNFYFEASKNNLSWTKCQAIFRKREKNMLILIQIINFKCSLHTTLLKIYKRLKIRQTEYNGRKRPQINKHEIWFFRFSLASIPLAIHFLCTCLPSHTNGVIVAGRPHE